MSSCITITFGDVAENHVGMQKLGEKADEGFTLKELKDAQRKLANKGYLTSLVKLHSLLDDVETDIGVDHAYILIIRGFVKNADAVSEELQELGWDTKAFMRGRVVNKHARHNLCFAEKAQEADFDEGRGTVVSFEDLPLLSRIREKLPLVLGEKARNLVAEGNLYYDVDKCGIGYHGDSERKIVFAIRLGASMKLSYQWYYKTEPVGRKYEVELNDGDAYVMSDKAVGYDWKRRIIYTLRHAAGCSKYTVKG